MVASAPTWPWQCNNAGLHVYAAARDPSKMTALDGLPNVTTLELNVVQPTHIKEAVELGIKADGRYFRLPH